MINGMINSTTILYVRAHQIARVWHTHLTLVHTLAMVREVEEYHFQEI